MAADNPSRRKVLARVALVVALCGCLVWLTTEPSLEAFVTTLSVFAVLLAEFT